MTLYVSTCSWYLSALALPFLVRIFCEVECSKFSCTCIVSPCREVVELFRRDELLDWGDFEATFGPVLRDGVEDGPATTVFQRGDTVGDQQWEDFRRRVIEHVRSVHVDNWCKFDFYLHNTIMVVPKLTKCFASELMKWATFSSICVTMDNGSSSTLYSVHPC